MKESLCCRAAGRFSKGQIVLIMDQLESSSESSELEELELELLEEDEVFFFLLFFFLSFFFRFFWCLEVVLGWGMVSGSPISESDKNRGLVVSR